MPNQFYGDSPATTFSIQPTRRYRNCEIQEGLNVIEHWNSVNDFILFGKGGDIATNRREDQELTILALHLLQNSLVYINTLMLQQVLVEEAWENRLIEEDFRGLNPLFYGHVNPYGSFDLDMNSRLGIEVVPSP